MPSEHENDTPGFKQRLNPRKDEESFHVRARMLRSRNGKRQFYNSMSKISREQD